MTCGTLEHDRLLEVSRQVDEFLSKIWRSSP